MRVADVRVFTNPFVANLIMSLDSKEVGKSNCLSGDTGNAEGMKVD